MKKNNSYKRAFTVLLMHSVATYFGCEKKTEENGDKDKTKTITK